jgi:tetratricopeptide (TPR) repeat protein
VQNGKELVKLIDLMLKTEVEVDSDLETSTKETEIITYTQPRDKMTTPYTTLSPQLGASIHLRTKKKIPWTIALITMLLVLIIFVIYWLIQIKPEGNTFDHGKSESNIQKDENLPVKLKEPLLKEKRISREYEKNIALAQQFFNRGQYDKALGRTEAAKRIEKTAEVLELEKMIENKRAEASQMAEKHKLNAEYIKYRELAVDYYKKKDYEKSQMNINKARKIKSTEEIDALEKKINEKKKPLKLKHREPVEEKRKSKELVTGKKDKKAVKKETIKPKTFKLKTVRLISLPPEMIIQYKNKVKKIYIMNLEGSAKPSGQITLTMSVDGDGKISVQSFKDTGLLIFPQEERENIKKLISAKFSTMTLVPPKDKQGVPVILQNWRVTYKVGYFGKKIILTKK